ncbi:hypothetical protein Rfer_4309 (plasmid) [Rhodoferax ferrireducens T118]|uniref:Uncharacterized protein n=1 Tax=Albidiferax ferrireducens (strain ATCC BAA-621 / DSM 15236 / T118) TaxID=338969 RepID=Q21QF0_ALBFT|nr:hypothetical protein Rfer_4309 [Rhodoferax ferrireducens T118]
MAYFKNAPLMIAAALIAALGLLSAFASRAERTVHREGSGNQAVATVAPSEGQESPLQGRTKDDRVARP